MSVRLGQSSSANSPATGNAAVRTVPQPGNHPPPGETFAFGSIQTVSKSVTAFSSQDNPTLSGGQRIFFYGVGLLLLVTAIAKLWMLLSDSFADVRVGISKELLWISVAFELGLAFENFRVRDARILAFLNVVVFSGFAIFSGVRWTMGYTSCGCSGKLEIPNWIFLYIDLGIITWLVATSVRRAVVMEGIHELVGGWRSLNPESRGKCAGIGIFLAALVSFQLPVSAPLRNWAIGESPIQCVVQVHGDLVIGRESSGHVEIWNHSHQPATIIGLSRSCECFDFVHDPVSTVIPANDRVLLSLKIVSKQSGPLHQRVVLFFHHPKQFRVSVDVVGSVKE